MTTRSCPDPTYVRVWEEALSHQDCLAVVRAMMQAPTAPGGVLRGGREVADTRLRQCVEHGLEPHDQAAVVAAMRAAGAEALRTSGGRAVMDGPKFCSYEQGSYFRAHCDASSDPTDPPQVVHRRVTLVCMLNDGAGSHGLPTFDGGTLVVHVPSGGGGIRPMNVRLAAGSIAAFGADLLHEVRPVRTGIRFSAVAWLYDVPPSTS